jgi:hypothetical protein
VGDGPAVAREEGPGERVGRPLVAAAERVVVAVVVVDEGRHHRAEELVAHQGVARVVDAHERRADEEALAVVGGAAEHLAARVGVGGGDAAGEAVPGAAVDDGAEEVAEVRRVAHAHLGEHPEDALAQRRPEADAGRRPRGRGALLPLVLVAPADDGHGERVEVGARVGEDEVLAAGLAHDARIRAVAVGADVRPRWSPTARGTPRCCP